MGQEVSVTTLQLAQAASVIANGGMLVRPRLVSRRGAEAVPVTPPVRIVRPKTAITMRQMMEQVVINKEGTGRRAKLAGYSVGGKTGSAQIFDYATRHYTHSYNGTFMGFAPVNNPAIVVVVTLNGTHGEGGFGGVVAAPVFHEIATEALRVLEVPKDLPDELPALVAANFEASDLADAEASANNILIDDDEEDNPAEQPRGVIGPPPPGKPSPAVPVPALPRVPDFKGKSMRAVLAEASAKGLTVLPDGSGIARVQNPPAGAVLHDGERIRVQFER
jgi:membrane peptidoglycan carboxypeptidase